MGITQNFRPEDDFLADSLAWLGARDGLEVARSITLDLTLFDPEVFAVNGFVPSGIALAKVTSGGSLGMYGPYTPGGANGLATMAGHSLHPARHFAGNTSVGGTRVGVALFWRGIIKEAMLPQFTGTAGEVDAAAKTAMVHIRYE